MGLGCLSGDGGPLRAGLGEQPLHAEGYREIEHARDVAVVTGDHGAEAEGRGGREDLQDAVSQVARDHHVR